MVSAVFCAETAAAAQLIAAGMHGQGDEAQQLAKRLPAQPIVSILVELQASMLLCNEGHGASRCMRNGPLISPHGTLPGVRHESTALDSQTSTAETFDTIIQVRKTPPQSWQRLVHCVTNKCCLIMPIELFKLN